MKEQKIAGNTELIDLQTQIVYLDFDGEQTTYCNKDLDIVQDVKVEDSGMTEEQKLYILSILNEKYADRGLVFTIKKPEETTEFSTVFIGKTDAFREYGFAGLAETIDEGNKIKNDNAFVFADAQTDSDTVISVIDHELSHIIGGEQHETVDGTLADYAASYTVSGSSLNVGTISLPATFSGTISSSVSVLTSGNGYSDCIAFSPSSSGTYTIKNQVSLLFGQTHTIKTYIRNSSNGALSSMASFNNNGSTSVYLSAGSKYYLYVQMLSPSDYTTTNYSYTVSIGGSSSPTPSTSTKPDLSVSYLTATDSTLNKTESLTLDFTIKNSGGSASGACFAYIYDDSPIYSSSQKMAQVTIDSIAAGSSKSYSYTFYPGELSLGFHSFRIVVDANEVVSESNEYNNKSTDRCYVTVENAEPDLSISSLSSSASTVFSTETITLDFTVKNSGNAYAGANLAYIYDGSNVVGITEIAGLSAGSSASYSYTIYPGTLSEGTHTLKVTVDGNEVIDESKESNNSSSSYVTVKIPKTDLSINSLEASGTTADAPVTLSFSVKNSGDVATGANFAYVYDGSTFIGRVLISALDAGKTASYSHTISAGILSDGTHDLRVVVDGNEVIAESDEGNNSTSCSFTFSPKPDLQPAVMNGWDDSLVVTKFGGTAKWSDRYNVGYPVDVCWAVKNAGGDITDPFTITLFVDNAEYEHWTYQRLHEGSTAYSYGTELQDLSAGIHTVRIVADSSGVIAESNEYNNDFSRSFVVAAEEKLKAASDYNGSSGSDTIQFVNGLVYVTHDTEDGYKQTSAINDITGWNVVEIRRDLTGDGYADLQIISDAGDGTTWVATLRNDYLTNGCVTLNYQFIRSYENELWSYIGSADFNGDGKAEVLLLQTEKGSDQGLRHVCAWGTNAAGEWESDLWVGSLTSEWNIAGTADVNGDGADNVLLRRADGMIGYWSVAGTNNLVLLKNAGDRFLVTTGDFDGDDADDLLLQSATDGTLSIWTDIGGNFTDTAIGKAGELGGSWTFAGVGDYNKDGTDELLWCNTSTYSTAYSTASKEGFKNLTVIA